MITKSFEFTSAYRQMFQLHPRHISQSQLRHISVGSGIMSVYRLKAMYGSLLPFIQDKAQTTIKYMFLFFLFCLKHWPEVYTQCGLFSVNYWNCSGTYRKVVRGVRWHWGQPGDGNIAVRNEDINFLQFFRATSMCLQAAHANIKCHNIYVVVTCSTAIRIKTSKQTFRTCGKKGQTLKHTHIHFLTQ